MWWLYLTASMAGHPFEGRSADISVSMRIDTPPERVTAALSDLPRVAGLFGEGCLVRWQVGVPESGPGARARVTYTPHLMRRRLTLEVEAVLPGQRVVWTHEGRNPFDTVWTVEAVAGGSEVRVDVPLEPPGWPLRRLFFLDIHPTWRDCYVRAIRALGAPLPHEGDANEEVLEDPQGELADDPAACPPGCAPIEPLPEVPEEASHAEVDR